MANKSSFFNREEYFKAYRMANADRVHDWPIKHPRRFRNTVLKRLYGIPLKQYNTLVRKQHNKCKICGKSSYLNNRRLFVDHCHKTGKIRGLLCRHCNTTLGRMNDSVLLLRKAIRYLQNV